MTEEQKDHLLYLISEYSDCCYDCGHELAENSEFILRDYAMDKIQKYLNAIVEK